MSIAAASALILGGLLLAFVVIRTANRRLKPIYGPLAVIPRAAAPLATDTLTVLTWNVGFAGLGKDADFFSDGGRSARPLSRAQITHGAKTIGEFLATQNADIACLQENANAGFLTRGVPVSKIIQDALPDHQSVFWSDMRSVLVPRFLNLDHGMSVHTRVATAATTAINLPQDEVYYFGMVKKHYGGLVTRLPIAGGASDWVVYNIHLSAFDAGGATRRDQLKTLLDMAGYDFAAGHHVIIGGDWNMRLSPSANVPTADTSWLLDLPQDAVPQGWRLAIDPATPTVRALDAPYSAGQTQTAIIDGFVVSPNVAVNDVATTDLGFAATDHHPVIGQFRAI